MKTFKDFKNAVQDQFKLMCASSANIFTTDVDKDLLWNTYLSSFPEGTNPIFRECAEFDCQGCRQFIRNYGNMVAIVDNTLVSIWDVIIDDHFQPVTNALSALVKKSCVSGVFISKENKLGTDKNRQMSESETVITWEHFFLNLPKSMVTRTNDSIGSVLSEYRSTKQVFKRSLDEISLDAINTVLELIEQNSLYRGAENKKTITNLLKCKKEYMNLEEDKQDNYCWVVSTKLGAVAKIRNSAIGTLLVDISDGKELDNAVGSFEAMVAPANYKRPNALITQSMIDAAREKVTSMGFENSLTRRHATVSDIAITNVLFADRTARISMNAFDALSDNVPVNIKKLKTIEEVPVKDFISDILPKVTSIELLFENKHLNKMMSLIAPSQESPSMFKWNNGFSWTYIGNIADSIKQRVKSAGGNVDGVLRCSLSWYNTDDLDIHMIEPDGNHIYYRNAKQAHRSSGILDVDMNVSNAVRDAVENITYTNKTKMQEGEYRLFVNNYTKRETIDIGFEVEIEFEREIFSFVYNKPVGHKKNVEVARFTFSQKDGIVFNKKLKSALVTKEAWGINTNSFHNVSMIMHSPNHWDEQSIGNKHYFFILEGCANPEKSRGFFNEFLKEELLEQKRVFEALGSKMMVDPSVDQLSGLGFSSTQRNNVLCKVSGSFSRTIKIIF